MKRIELKINYLKNKTDDNLKSYKKQRSFCQNFCGNFVERHSFRVVSGDLHDFHTRESDEITVFFAVSR